MRALWVLITLLQLHHGIGCAQVRPGLATRRHATSQLHGSLGRPPPPTLLEANRRTAPCNPAEAPRPLPLLQAAAAVAAGGATWAQPALQPHRRLLANDTGGSSSSSSSSSSGTAAQGALSTRKRCAPSLVDVARQQPELRQAVQLARSGYNLFSVDGGKPFTVLVPTNDALQQLAAGACWGWGPVGAGQGEGGAGRAAAGRLRRGSRPAAAATRRRLCWLRAGIDSLDDQLSLEDGFYSVLLYHQIPQG